MGNFTVKKYSQDSVVSLYHPRLVNWVITPSASGAVMLVRDDEFFNPFLFMFKAAIMNPYMALLEYGEDVLDVAKYVAMFPDKEFRIHDKRHAPALDVNHGAIKQFLEEYTDV